MNESLEKLKNALKKPHVNSACIWCGACSAIAGDVFELDDAGLSCVNSLASYPKSDVDDAISACPVSAISWQETDEKGAYLNGVTEHEDVA